MSTIVDKRIESIKGMLVVRSGKVDVQESMNVINSLVEQASKEVEEEQRDIANISSSLTVLTKKHFLGTKNAPIPKANLSLILASEYAKKNNEDLIVVKQKVDVWVDQNTFYNKKGKETNSTSMLVSSPRAGTNLRSFDEKALIEELNS